VHLPRQALNLPRAGEQHQSYVAALRAAKVDVTILPEEPDMPDAVFVEDTVLMLDELAVLCRLGCASREPETKTIMPVISALRRVFHTVLPGTLEGGDVLRIEKTLFVGLSSRTNREGIRQLEEVVRSFGYRVVGVSVNGCLHLKTAITAPANDTLIANPAWIDLSPFRKFDLLTVPESEPWGANTLSVNGQVFVAKSAPRSAEMLESKGLSVHSLDISELQKAEAGLTCLSVLW
jgi:dimethylargininase